MMQMTTTFSSLKKKTFKRYLHHNKQKNNATERKTIRTKREIKSVLVVKVNIFLNSFLFTISYTGGAGCLEGHLTEM